MGWLLSKFRIKRLKLLAIFLVFNVFILPLSQQTIAQEKQFMFKTIDIEKGLSNNNANVFLRDSKGFLWVGTVDGLNRYDGYSFKTYKNNPSDSSTLSSNAINYLAEDYNGSIWVGAGEFLDILNPVTNKIQRAKTIFNGKLEFYQETRWTLQKDKLNHYWYLSSKQGVYKYFVTEDSLVKVLDLPEGNWEINRHLLTGIAFDSDDNLWTIDYLGKIYKIHNQSLKMIDSLQIGSTMDNFYKIFIDADNDLWISDWNNNIKGIKYINLKTRKVESISTRSSVKLSSDIVRHVTQDANGLIWVGTDHGGVTLIDKKTRKVQYLLNDPLNNRSLAENAVTSLYRDYEGFIWLSTFKKGFSYYHSNLFKFDHFKIMLPNNETPNLNDIDNFTEDKDGNLWIGTNGAGLVYFDRKNNRYKLYRHNPNDPNSLSSDILIGLTTDKKGNVWIGTYFGGLNKWDGTKFTHFKNDPSNTGTITDDRVWDICEDDEGYLWIATLLGGVNVLNPKSGKVIAVYRWLNDTTIRSNVIYSIIQDKDKLMWFATVDGVRSYNKKTKKFEYFSNDPADPNSLSSNLVFDVMEDSRGLIWAATSNGINIINKKTKKITHLAEAEGLPVNRIVTLLEDNNHTVWASTSNGLTNINVNQSDTSLIFNIINYDKLDGLQGKEFNEKAAFKTSNGELIFGGSNGYNLFKPEQVQVNVNKNHIVFTDFQVYNKSYTNHELLNGRYLFQTDIPYASGVVLKYDENIFTIEFSNLNYFHPERHKYQYKLENFNNTWLEASSNNRRITYTNLNPGNYEFRVRTANADGTLNHDFASFFITILPPWWQTLWFRLVFAFGVIGLTFLFYYWRFKQLNHQKKLLGEMVLQRTQELTKVNTMLEERQEEISIQNDELNLHREKLESLVEMRTRALEEALKKAEDSDKLKSAFLANMSHEIRTPMNAIVGFSNLLRELELTKTEHDDYLDIIIKNCNSLLVIINDILDISRIEANQFKINKNEFDLLQMFDDLNSFYSLRKTAKVDIIYVKPTIKPPLIINHDEVRIKQLVQNIMDNALKFTENGYVKFGFEIKDNLLWCFIEDTGKGIAPEQQQNIFKPFVKIEEDRTKFIGGAGLGLAICQRITQLMNGEIYFESLLGKGTTFHFKIPIE